MNYRGFDARGKFGPRGRHGFGRHQHGFFNQKIKHVPANIEEIDDRYVIYLYAPELDKENLKVFTKDDVLNVEYTPKEEETATHKFTRKEYGNWPFKRAFSLNDKVLADQISALYKDGILRVDLPKNPETNSPAKDIAVD
ncbi:Hsp20/alpha crystallin family protein [Pedobacter sp. AW1-32]|uniref:Hsp20/alpha crystallin family protein n=1 Tax=Pedobacter sp. AW1-32 TaxID=3383026 RepID=UPI003FEF5BE2